jgi:hypothetical protein
VALAASKQQQGGGRVRSRADTSWRARPPCLQVRALQLYAHDFGAAGRSAEGGAFGQAAGGGKGLQHVSLANGTLCEARRAISGGDLCAAVSDLQRLTRLALALPLWLSAQQPLLALQQLTALRSCDLTLLPLLQHEMTVRCAVLCCAVVSCGVVVSAPACCAAPAPTHTPHSCSVHAAGCTWLRRHTRSRPCGPHLALRTAARGRGLLQPLCCCRSSCPSSRAAGSS